MPKEIPVVLIGSDLAGKVFFKESKLGVLTLVCNVCQAFERVDDHSIEADVVTTNDGVWRYCKRCGNSTIWKVGQPTIPFLTLPAATENPAQKPVLPARKSTQKSGFSGVNRRKYPRIKVNYRAGASPRTRRRICPGLRHFARRFEFQEHQQIYGANAD